MMTFLLSAPASTKWLGWRKDRKSLRDRLGRFCDIYCAVILRYLLSVTFCGAVGLKVMDQKTLVERRWSYKVRTVYIILTLGEFARHELTNLWLETLPDTLSFSEWKWFRPLANSPPTSSPRSNRVRLLCDEFAPLYILHYFASLFFLWPE